MQNKILSIFAVFVVVVLAGHGAVWAGQGEAQQSIQKGTEASMQRLGQLDSKIEILKKKLEIKELESKIAEAENEKKSQLQLEKNAENFSHQLGQVPFDGQSVSNSDTSPRRSKPQIQSDSEKQQQDVTQTKQFNQYLSQTRVVSVSGVDGNIRAEIRLPQGGSLGIKEGQNTDRLGRVTSVSLDSVVVKKNDETFHVPFSEDFKKFSATVKPTIKERPDLAVDSADISSGQSSQSSE